MPERAPRCNAADVARNRLPSTTPINEIEAAASEVRIKALRLMTPSDNPEHSRKASEALISGAEERSLIDASADLWSRYERADGEMRRMIISGKQAEALAHSSGADTVKIHDDAQATFSRPVASNERNADREVGKAVQRAKAAA
jgi:methyl-accepting chemotaxis protein